MYRIMSKGQLVNEHPELAALSYASLRNCLSWRVERQMDGGPWRTLAYVELAECQAPAPTLVGKEACAWAIEVVRSELLSRSRLCPLDFQPLWVGECWRPSPALPYVSPRELQDCPPGLRPGAGAPSR